LTLISEKLNNSRPYVNSGSSSSRSRAIGSIATPVFAEDDDYDKKYLKCYKYDKDDKHDKDYDKHDDGDYFLLKCKKYKD
jgi:hypothetical protein